MLHTKRCVITHRISKETTTSEAQRVPLTGSNPIDREMLRYWNSLEIPVLGEILVGPTGYLDQLESLRCLSMKGVDEYGRHFIAARLEREGVEYVNVYHQRYSDENTPWVAAGPYSCGLVGEEDMLAFFSIMDGAKVNGVRLK